MGRSAAVSAKQISNEAILMPQVVKFLFAGGFAALISWFIRFPLSEFMPFAAAVPLANAIGMVLGFVLYRYFVFPGSTRDLRAQVPYFLIVNAVGLVIGTVVAVLFLDYLLPLVGFEWHAEAIAHAAGIGVAAVSNFFGHRHLSFGRT